METKHTKTKWSYYPELSAVITIVDHKVKCVADFGKCDLPENEANAKLIAAAPDLLEACKEAKTIIYNLRNGLYEERTNRELQSIFDQAINKATL